MGRLGQTGVMLVHHRALEDLDTRNRGAQTQAGLRIEAQLAQLGNPLDVDQMLRAAHAGAHLDQDVRAAA